MAKIGYKIPLWLKEIVNNNANFKIGSLDVEDFVVVGNTTPKRRKIRVAILRDGPFLPAMTGASASILGMANSLIKNDIEIILIKCFRKNDDISLYKKQSFPTIFVNEESFYGGKGNILRKILIDCAVDIVHFDSAEAVNIQAKYIPEKIHKVFEVHNVEHDLLKQLNADKKTVDYIKREEKKASLIADAILFRSAGNLNAFRKLGAGNLELKSSVYRGGINIDGIFFDKKRFKNNGDVLFLGHLNYEPNIQALKIIKKFVAPKIKRDILVVGNYGERVKKEMSSKKIKFLGWVDDLNDVFNQCSVAIAPLISGSGTRLKILDYGAAGLPVVCTDLSVDGLEPEIKKYAIIENDFTKYPHCIENIKKIYSEKNAVGARRYILKNRNWDNIIGDVIGVYKKLMLRIK